MHSQKHKIKVTTSYEWTIRIFALCLNIAIYRLRSLMHCVISNTIFDVNLLEWTEKQENTGYCCILHWAWHVSLKWQQLTIITKNGQMHACIMNGEMLVTWASYHHFLIAAILLLLLAHCKFTHQRKWQILGQWEENIDCSSNMWTREHICEFMYY